MNLSRHRGGHDGTGRDSSGPHRRSARLVERGLAVDVFGPWDVEGLGARVPGMGCTEVVGRPHTCSGAPSHSQSASYGMLLMEGIGKIRGHVCSSGQYVVALPPLPGRPSVLGGQSCSSGKVDRESSQWACWSYEAEGLRFASAGFGPWEDNALGLLGRRTSLSWP